MCKNLDNNKCFNHLTLKTRKKYNIIFQKYSKGWNHFLSMYKEKLTSKVYFNFKEKKNTT